MSNVVCAVSSGICACSGEGVEQAFLCATNQTKDFFSPNTTFDSPRHCQKQVGIASANCTQKFSKLSHCAKILFSAIEQALFGLDLSGVPSNKISIYFGTSIGGIFEAENMLVKNITTPESESWEKLRFYECSTIAELAAKHFGFLGESITYSTACSSSSLALADACNAITQGDSEIAIVCGADAISRITVNGFGSLLLLSQGRAKPFDENRDGINLGEAGVAIVLASKKIAEKISSQKPLAYISGWGTTADAYHATAPNPTGEGAARAMNIAIERSGIEKSEISYYNAHGTGTKGNDSSEFVAMQSVFGADVLPYSSVKRAFGHTLGASGVLNVILTIESMRRGKSLVNAGFESNSIDVSKCPILKSENIEIKNALSVSLGFGGNNAVSVISKEEPKEFTSIKKRLFIYSVGKVEPKDKSNVVEMSELLKDVAPLKKRRWAKLQQMALDCATSSLNDVQLNLQNHQVGVCLGTGLGMVAETQRFVEAVILSKEAEPIPSAFTNSVHNATSSAVAQKFSFKGLNSATTAKEVSFECALKQAWREINAGGISVALVGACDEHSLYAEKFLNNHAIFAKQNKTTDFACVYLVASEGVQSAPLAEVKALKISRVNKNEETESEFLKDFISENGGVDCSVCLCANNVYQQKFIDNVLCLVGVGDVERINDCSNYSTSAKMIEMSLRKHGKRVLNYTLSSTGLRAVSIVEIL